MTAIFYIIYGARLSAKEVEALPEGIRKDDLEGNADGELCLVPDGDKFVFGYYADWLSTVSACDANNRITLHDGDFTEWERCFEEALEENGLSSNIFNEDDIGLHFVLQEVSNV